MAGCASLAELFANACRWIGPRAFLTDPAVRLSGQAAGLAVARASARLSRAGLGPGDRAAILAGPSVAQAVGFFAVQAAGGVACCLHLRDTDARLAETIAALAPRLLLADAGSAERAARLGAGTPLVALDELAAAADDPAAPAARAPGDPAVILLSSGTTGRPKLVLHTQASLLATAAMAGPVYGALGPGDAVAVPMAPSFAAWVHTVLPFVALRARIVFVPRFEAADYLALLAAEAVTVAALVPTLWAQVLPVAREQGRPPALRVAMFSGEPGTPDLVRGLAALAPQLRSVHLASEAGCAAGIVATEEQLAAGGAAAAGWPVPGADAMVIDPDAPDLRPLPAGETGEIAVRGPSLAAGYLGDPELTARRFVAGWWRSGDLGRRGADGLLHVKGRTDNRINSGGIKVHAEEVEAALLSLGLLRAAAVIGVPDPRWGERIEAHVVPARPDVTAARVSEALAAAGLLPRALQPKAIHLRETLPTTPTGKLWRGGLRR